MHVERPPLLAGPHERDVRAGSECVKRMMDVGISDKVVILDRDGTIVIDRGYLADPAGLEFMPGAAAGLRCLWEHGCRLVVITNQSGVGRGLFSLERVEAMNTRLHAMVEEAGARLSGIYVCPHAPEANCACRKPNLALMQQAASELNFNPQDAVVVGDKESDIEFAIRAAARAILISSGPLLTAGKVTANLTVPTLMEAARSITSQQWWTLNRRHK